MSPQVWKPFVVHDRIASAICFLFLLGVTLGITAGCGGKQTSSLAGNSNTPANPTGPGSGGPGSGGPGSGGPGSGGPGSGGGSGGTGSGNAGASAFLFAGNNDAIWAGKIDSTSGQVSSVAGGQTDGAVIASIGSDPQGRFLYSAQQANTGSAQAGSTGIGVFAIDAATGNLTRGTTVALPNAVDGLAIDASGKSIYATENSAIRVFTVSPSGPSQVSGSPFAAATVGRLSALTPDGHLLINVGGGLAAVFAIDPVNGQPREIAGSPFPTGASSEQQIAISPNGMFLFILTAGSPNGNLIEMTISSGGVLAAITECHRTSPKTVGCFPPPVLGAISSRHGSSATPSIVVDPTSQFLYLLTADANGASRVVGLVLSNSGGMSIMNGSPFAHDVIPNSIAMDSGAKYLYLGAPGAVSTYAIDGTGRLTLASITKGFSVTSNLVAAR
jgi:6-phosphogluconolactonase (cycloisomerase 2 family)